ncbi:MAG: hypothetical protein GY862_07455 [Gammaproteobacteria bacterium]|nr:hypothetical protein [Gammaproteobacteria bacterium]
MMKIRLELFALFFCSSVFFGHYAAADGVQLRNGDRISGRLVNLSATHCIFKTPYQEAALRIKTGNILHLETSRPVAVKLHGGETLIGSLSGNESGNLSLHSQRLGVIALQWEEIAGIADVPQPVNVAGLLETQGKNAGGNSQANDTESKPETPDILGEEPEEDLRQIFLRESAVLLKSGEKELGIGLSYARHSSGSSRSRNIGFSLNLQTNLTGQLEAVIGVPVTWAEREIFSAEGIDNNSDFGIGDVTGGLKYDFDLRGKQWPNLIGSLRFTAPAGNKPDLRKPGKAAVGGGHWQVSAGLTLVKSYDPAAVFGSIGYIHTFKETFDGLEVSPGRNFSYSFGLGFAINRQLSLNGQFRGAYQTETKVNGVKLPGSSEPMNLRTGLTYRLAKGRYLQPGVSFALNDDAADTVLDLSYAHKF